MAFKMRGHTLPGINKKAGENMRDGRSKSAAFQYKSAYKLTDKQEALDVNNNNRLDADDFAGLRAEKSPMNKKGCAMCNYGKKKCTCGMASPKKYGKTAMKMDGKKKLKKAKASPTASEKATMKAHNQALKDNPKLYKDSYYDDRRKKAKLIKSKYPGYKF